MTAFLFSLSAFLLLQAPKHEAALIDLYKYDSTKRLDYQEKLIEQRDAVKIFEASYASPKSGRVPMYVVVPPGKGPFAGILFQHGGSQTRYTYLSEAVLLARVGALSLVLDDEPRDTAPMKPKEQRDEYIRMVVDMRRAVDLLLARGDVDRNRIGYVGHSYGSMLGSVLTAVDKRIKTFILLGTFLRITDLMRNSPYWAQLRKETTQAQFNDHLAVMSALDADRYISRSGPASLFVQCGRFDAGVTKEDCGGLYEAAGEPKRLAWYSSDHDLNDLGATLDRMSWLEEKLLLNPLWPVLQKSLEGNNRKIR